MAAIDVCSAAVAGIVFAAWCVSVVRRKRGPPAGPTQERRFTIAWEVRGLVLVVAGPLAAAMLAGHVPWRYAIPIVLGTIAGLLVAEIIAPLSIGRADR